MGGLSPSSTANDYAVQGTDGDTPAADYVGRFAPSPTGPLHFGSLLAALASYLDAHAHQGRWLVRIEDLDPPREIPGASDAILRALESHGLLWDDSVIYQSQRYPAYQFALQQLIDSGSVFPCQCSRKQLASSQGIHLGQCHGELRLPHAWRFNAQTHLKAPTLAQFDDQLQGRFSQSVTQDIGDFVVKRKDQLWAYQLAMVVDDQHQNISHVVRGIDLIDSSLRQNMLQRALGYRLPHYAHIPVACGGDGQKLSKQNRAPKLDLHAANQNLWQALQWLKQSPPHSLRQAAVSELLDWGIEHWQPQRLQGLKRQPGTFGLT